MRYVLIDTNCWVDLLANESQEKNLKSLELCVSKKAIILLVPERLTKEWIRNKNGYLNKVRESVNVGIHGFRRDTQKRLKQELKRSEQKAQRINRLLERGKICSETKAVHAEVGDRRSKESAPYHGNPNSDGDAYIYFTATKYCKSKKLPELIFISHDKQAFSHPEEETALHPDLYVDGIQLNYFYGIGPGTDSLRKLLGSKEQRNEENVDFESIFYIFEDNETVPLVEKINKALDVYHDQLPFIPTDFLVKVYPFKIIDPKNDYTYHSSFQINTNNNSLAEFFQSVQIDKNDKISFRKLELVTNVKSSKQKVYKILQRLNHNLIFDISAISSNIEADLRLNRENKKETIQEKFNNLDFLSVYHLLKNRPQKDMRETLQQAYLHFQFGYFDVAIQLFDSVYEKARSTHKTILCFIALYNMKRLKSFINSYYVSNDSQTIQIIKKIDRLSIRKFSADHDDEPFIQEVITWIANTDFYHEAFMNLTETVEKIRDHYNLQLKGGFSTNSNYQKLISDYLGIDQFLELNCIIFNSYSNYEELTEKLAEGLFMMHEFSKKQSVRVDTIDYFLLQKMIFYAKRETLVKFYHRYSMKGLAKKDLDEKRSVLKIAERFFSDYGKLRELLNKDEEKNPYFFWEKYYKVAGNLLLIITISKSEEDLTDLARKIMDVLADDFISKRLEMEHVAEFIREKGKYIQTSVLKKFLVFAIDNDRLHNVSIFNALVKQMRSNHKGLVIKSKTVAKKLQSFFFHECPKCKTFHEPSLLKEIYFLLDEPFKKQVESLVIKKLSKEFNVDLYYFFSMYRIIDYKLFFKEFLDACPPLKNTKPKYNFFGASEATYSRLNQVINLAFEFQINTKEELYPRYKDSSLYYDWLLDMDDFDYSQFDPEWILMYKTEVYFRRIFACQQVRKYLVHWFKRRKHPVLHELIAEYGFSVE